jgi:molybdopterin converting factor small subunit
LRAASNITVNVLFFGATFQVVHTRQTQVEIEPCRASDLIERIVDDHPDLSRHKLLFSVNQEYVPDHVQLKDRDEVAIFTAVSGG